MVDKYLSEWNEFYSSQQMRGCTVYLRALGCGICADCVRVVVIVWKEKKNDQKI